MKKLEIFIATEKTGVQAGFHFQPGFAAIFDGGNLVAATSGWECGGMIFVYRPFADGKWEGNWEGPETFPMDSVLNAIQEWQDDQEFKKALTYAGGKKLHLSNVDVIFWDIAPGKKCNDGGEYGFYTVYSPIEGYPGIYCVYTESTCNFDACGTGYVGIRALTVQDYRRLKKASDKIKDEGSLY